MANRKKITPPELSPEIVLFHILPKLPGKSLLRFKCVCKQWRSFLTSPLFVKTHLHHVTTTDRYRHEKIIFFHNRLTSLRDFGTINCEDGAVTKPRCYPFVVYAPIIASSVNGLVCAGTRKRSSGEFSNMIIWNSLTGEYKNLPKPIDTNCYGRNSMVFELYYTCSDDDYKILSITTDRNVYIYSLRSDSWRKLESTLDYEDRIPFASDHNLLDEKLHFLRPLKIYKRYIIIRLDLKTEKFTKIAIPSSCGDGDLSLKVVRGCIELTIFNWVLLRTWMIEMWRMNGDGDWMKMVNISYSPDRNRITTMKPLYLMWNGNFIMGNMKSICKVDPEKNIEDELYSSPNTVVILPRIYIETFVSPNQYVN